MFKRRKKNQRPDNGSYVLIANGKLADQLFTHIMATRTIRTLECTGYTVEQIKTALGTLQSLLITQNLSVGLNTDSEIPLLTIKSNGDDLPMQDK